jgi:hypothetical protein
MKLSPWTLSAAAALLAAPLAAAGSVLGSPEQGQVVARAGGMELGVEEAASLLAENPDIADDPGVVADMADLWVDYTLMAAAAYSGPGELDPVLDRLAESGREDRLIAVMLSGEALARADTVFSEDEVRAAWAPQATQEIRVRHILLRLPPGATPAQRDSVARLAESLRARAAGGEDFAGLARRYSADESAAKGGDVGFISRIDMVAGFTEVAFELEVGEVSPVVETRLGLHVIRAEEKRAQPGPPPEGFERAMAQDAAQAAASRFVDSLTAAAETRVEPGAVGVLREIAVRGSARESGTVLVSYRGGEVTAGEAALLLSAVGATNRQWAAEYEEEAARILGHLATREILLREARARGVTLPPAAHESLRSDLRGMLEETLAQADLEMRPTPAAENARDAAVQKRVRSLLRGVVLGDHHLKPLGVLGSALRADGGALIFPETFPRVVERMVALRRGRPRPPKTSGPGSPWARIP